MKRTKLEMLALLALVGVGGCGTASSAGGGQKLAAMPENPEALIQMRRGACAPDLCSVYSVSIFTDGTVAYDGRANVSVVGQRRGKMSADRLSELISTIETMGFLDLPASGCVCSSGTGRQMVTVDYRPGSVQKTVIHDSGCWSAPPALGALEAAIDRATGVDQWVAPPTAAKAPVGEGTAPQASLPTPEAPPGETVAASPGVVAASSGSDLLPATSAAVRPSTPTVP